MIQENKNNWMIWAIAALVLLNISTLVTIFYQRNKETEPDQVYVTDPEASESSSLKYSNEYFSDQLNLNNAQMDKFSEFNPGFRQKIRSINIEMADIRNEMLREMTAEKSDARKLEKLSDSMGNLHAELKKETFQYYLNLKSICNADQREELEKLFSIVFTSDSLTGINGKGGQQLRLRRRQHGRQFN